jgi:hypothetical protein
MHVMAAICRVSIENLAPSERHFSLWPLGRAELLMMARYLLAHYLLW